MLVIVKMEDEKERKELLEMGREIWKRWRIGVEKDLTLEERRIRWGMMEKARSERVKGRHAVVSGKRMWMEGREWRWDESRGELREKDREKREKE